MNSLPQQLEQAFNGRTVLVTGAGGSIGSQVCRQLAALRPACLLLLDFNENGVYLLSRELAEQGFHAYKIIIGSICSQSAMERLFSQYQPDLVVHTAAHKHVPLMEEHVLEAVSNNIGGTLHLAQCACRHNTGRFLLISTDKAVRPRSVMGATKRVCEQLMLALNTQYDTAFSTIRFGNILGSNGSVLPIFERQIAAGGPVTVTDPAATRYFTTVEQAARSILEAASIMTGGELFVRDMGDPISIDAFAKELIAASGKPIQIQYTGLRPGERLHEALVTPEEALRPTSVPGLQVAAPSAPALDVLLARIHLLFASQSDDQARQRLEFTIFSN